MNQRKKEQTKSNGSLLNGDGVIDHAKMTALQQYRDTEGHFSLVRYAMHSQTLTKRGVIDYFS